LNKIKVISVSLPALLITWLLFIFYDLKTIIIKTRFLSNFFKMNVSTRLDLILIHSVFSKTAKIFRQKSCLKNCIALKMIYAFFGFDVEVNCGVKIKADSSLDGHAWLTFNKKLIAHKVEEINDYVISFKI
tara:strand:- start:755 stop:1147 length:393 start_codon:yes stop_codon:yes gene_type:complete